MLPGTNLFSDLPPLQLLRVAHLGTGRRILYKYRRQVNHFCLQTFLFSAFGDEGVAAGSNPDSSPKPSNSTIVPLTKCLLVIFECPVGVSNIPPGQAVISQNGYFHCLYRSRNYSRVPSDFDVFFYDLRPCTQCSCVTEGCALHGGNQLNIWETLNILRSLNYCYLCCQRGQCVREEIHHLLL